MITSYAAADSTLLKKRVLDWLDGLRIGDSIGFPIATSSPHYTLEATVFAILTYELFGALESVLVPRRQQWADWLLSCQDSRTGLFLDPLLRPEDLLSPLHDWEYVTWQMTSFALAALDTLGARPRYRLSFLDPVRTPAAIVKRLEGGAWSEPWGESNRVMFLTEFLLQEHEIDLAHVVLDWLDAHQDADTGFWGTRDGADLLSGMAAGFHFYFFYFALGRPVHYPTAIIDHTLALQQADGLYTRGGGGGACADLDAVDTLVKFSLLTDYRAEDIKSSLARSFAAIVANQRPTGAFCEALRPVPPKSLKRTIGEALLLDRLLHKPYEPYVERMRYAGWSKMEYTCEEGDLWSTWFRPLALALISTRYPGEFIDDIAWTFRRKPGLGWHDPIRLRVIKEKYYG